MKLSAGVRSNLFTAFSSMKNRLNVFYVLASAPILLTAYYNIHYLSPLMFGFLLLLLKKDNLSAYHEAKHTQKAAGLILIIGSFIVYYTFIFPFFLLYGLAATYVAYILGLFLIFFDLSALREAFTPVFIVIAAASSSYVLKGVELYLSPSVIPLFTSLIGAILNALAVRTTVQYPDLITLHTWRGSIPLQIIWGCVGPYGVLIFSILMVIILSEEPVNLKTKISWAVIGIIGILVLNIARVTVILVLAYYYSAEVAEQLIHPFLGYALFFIWLAIFLYIFSKRQTLRQKIRLILGMKKF